MPQTDALPQQLKEAPPIILSVLETFKVTTSFVAGIDDYHHPQSNSTAPGKFTTEWISFLDRYAIMMWNSRDICTNAEIQIDKLNGVFTFVMQDPPNLPVIKAKVEDYLSMPDGTIKKSQELVESLKQLDQDINQWKHTVFDWIDKNVPKHDDGTSTYRMLMKALSDLKERLPPEDRTDMKSAWFSNSLKPTTTSTVEIQKAWINVWYEASVVAGEIKAADDAVTIKKLRKMIEKASSDYNPLKDACRQYGDSLYQSNLYAAYQEAIKRQQ